MGRFYILSQQINIDVYVYINHRFLFNFFNVFFKLFDKKTKKKNFFFKIYKKSKALDFIKKYPKMKKKYRKINRKNKLLSI